LPHAKPPEPPATTNKEGTAAAATHEASSDRPLGDRPLVAKLALNPLPFAVVKKKKVGLFFSKRKIYHPPAQQCNHAFSLFQMGILFDFKFTLFQRQFLLYFFHYFIHFIHYFPPT
jgi:hypothetical protein